MTLIVFGIPEGLCPCPGVVMASFSEKTIGKRKPCSFGESVMMCPNCETEMEEGHIRVGRFLVAVKWVPESWGKGVSSTYIRNNSPAHHCLNCGIVVLFSG